MTKVNLDKLNKIIPQTVVYKSVGEKELRLFVFEPMGKPTGCVLLLHGGGWKRETPSRLFPHGAYFAENGAVAVCIEYRLMDEKIDVRDCLEDCVDALIFMRRYLEEKYKQMTITAFGDSAGAYLATCLGTQSIIALTGKNVNRVDFVVDLNGIVDLTGKWNYAIKASNDSEKSRLEVNYSPLYNVSKSDASVLLVHGGQDSVVDINDSKRYTEALASKQIENGLWVLPEAQHAFILFDYVHDNAFVAKVLEKIVRTLKAQNYI